jgi:hypothetical protein
MPSTKTSLRTALLTGLTLAATMAASGIATAQVEDQPRATFEREGRTAIPSPYAASPESPEFRRELPRNELRQRPGGGWFAHGEADDPPGSAFQDYGEDQSLGEVR